MKGSRILLVDDEVVFAENMKTLLTSRGYFATAVHGGEDALKALEESPYDVVVLDLKMPGMDGLAVLGEIGKMGIHTKVLMLTGHGSVDSALQAIKMGAYDYLAKPCGIDELTAKIEGAWAAKTETETRERDEMIQKIVESPSSVFGFLGKKKKKEKE